MVRRTFTCHETDEVLVFHNASGGRWAGGFGLGAGVDDAAGVRKANTAVTDAQQRPCGGMASVCESRQFAPAHLR